MLRSLGSEGANIRELQFPKSKMTCFKDLAGELIDSCEEEGGTGEKQLTLHAHNIPSATFKWCLTTMGVSHLTLRLLLDPPAAIVCSEDESTLIITGMCAPYDGWDIAQYTIVLSSGDAQNSLVYADTAITAEYVNFSIPLLAEASLLQEPSSGSSTTLGLPRQAAPSPFNAAAAGGGGEAVSSGGLADGLPPVTLPLVMLRVQSSSRHIVPNCHLQLCSGRRAGGGDTHDGEDSASDGDSMVAICPDWVISEAMRLSTSTLALSIVNKMTKGGSVTRSLTFTAAVLLGGLVTPIAVVAPVGCFSMKDTWYAQFSCRAAAAGAGAATTRGALEPAGLYLGPHLDLVSALPASMVAQGGFSLTHYYLQFQPGSGTVLQVSADFTTPSWTVVPPQTLVLDTSVVHVQIYNPLAPHNSSISMILSGKSGAEASMFEPNSEVFATPCSNIDACSSTGSVDWVFKVCDEDDRTLVAWNRNFADDTTTKIT